MTCGAEMVGSLHGGRGCGNDSSQLRPDSSVITHNNDTCPS